MGRKKLYQPNILKALLLKQKEKANFSEKDISDVVDSDATSDFLLARAPEEIDNERENIYERPRGKNYRIAEREIDTINVMKIKQGKLLAKEDADLADSFASSCGSLLSVDGDDVQSEINSEIIEFINEKNDFILKLVSDRYCSSPDHIRSERLVALSRGASLKRFEEHGVSEYLLICQKMAPFIGTSFDPYAPYTHHICFQILIEKQEANPDDIFDYSGYFPVPMHIRTLPDRYKTIELVLLPEILTEFIMKKEGICYKEASQYFYPASLPTIHHIPMLINDKKVIFSIDIHVNEKHVTLQIVENNLALQRTHAIVNAPNRQLVPSDKVSLALINQGGSSIEEEENNNYIETNGILNTGDVICTSPGKLGCFYLFHAIRPEWSIDTPEEHVFKKMFSSLLLQVDKYQCKSVSMPSFNCEHLSQRHLRKNIRTVTEALLQSIPSDLKELSIIRIVSTDTTVRETFTGARKSIWKPMDPQPKGRRRSLFET